MKVKIIKDYNDIEKKRLVKEGEEFEVTEERGKTLIAAKVAEIVNTSADDDPIPTEATPKTATKTKRRGKKKEK